jgi:hypothetical protein
MLPLRDAVHVGLGALAALTLLVNVAAMWPSNSGTTAPGVVIENGTSGGLGSLTTTPLAVTPGAGTTATITTGGTAVTLVSGPLNGGYIINPLNLAAQGIGAAENAYVDPVGTPGSTDANANGTTVLLTPGQIYSIPPLAAATTIKANAATNGHKLTVVKW